MEKVCILGAGTYGSYLANALAEKYPQVQIKLLEVGDGKTKDEEKIGFFSSLKKDAYRAIKEGRFFGLGGTSARWAGQLLFFSKHDVPNDERMNDIKYSNIKYKENVLKRFFKKVPELRDFKITDGLYFKQGIWLKYSQRNFFKYFKVNKLKNVEIIKGARVVKLNVQDQKLSSVTLKVGICLEKIEADRFYLTCGAFESLRILGVSGICDLEKTTSGFCDRVSMKGFTVLHPRAKLFNVDFTQRFVNNSLKISRIIGEVNGSSFYMKAIFNKEFILIRQLKNLLSNKEHPFSLKECMKGLKQIHHMFLFVYYYLFYKKVFISKTWDINIDIEMDPDHNKIKLSKQKDGFDEQGLDIYFAIPPSTVEKLQLAKNVVKDVLLKNRVPFRETDNSVSTIIDTLHPYNLYHSQKDLSFKKIFNPLSNLFVFHTGILRRIGGVNPTASLLCLIEKHVIEDFFNTL